MFLLCSNAPSEMCRRPKVVQLDEPAPARPAHRYARFHPGALCQPLDRRRNSRPNLNASSPHIASWARRIARGEQICTMGATDRTSSSARRSGIRKLGRRYLDHSRPSRAECTCNMGAVKRPFLETDRPPLRATWPCSRLMRPISARYPAGLSLRVSARILASRLAS